MNSYGTDENLKKKWLSKTVTIWSFCRQRYTLSGVHRGPVRSGLFVLDSVLQYEGGESVPHALTETTVLADHFDKSLNGY
jgi:hypothetical protein